MRLYLNKMRKKKGMSLSELSRRSGVAKSTLFYIEINATDPKVGTLCKVAKALDIHVIDLFSCEDR